MLSDPTRRSLRWWLNIAFGAVFIGSTALYYALDVRFCPENEGGCIYSRADFAEGSAAAHRVSELRSRSPL